MEAADVVCRAVGQEARICHAIHVVFLSVDTQVIYSLFVAHLKILHAILILHLAKDVST